MSGDLFKAMKFFLDYHDLNGLISFLDNYDYIPEVDTRDNRNFTFLMVCSGCGVWGFCEELLNRGANINALDINNATPLIHAAKYGRIHVVINLIDRGANMEQCDNNNMTALSWCIRGGFSDCAQTLVSKGASPNCSLYW